LQREVRVGLVGTVPRSGSPQVDLAREAAWRGQSPDCDLCHAGPGYFVSAHV